MREKEQLKEKHELYIAEKDKQHKAEVGEMGRQHKAELIEYDKQHKAEVRNLNSHINSLAKEKELLADTSAKEKEGTGNATSFSFHVHKNMTTAEGGMVTTDNDEWARNIRIMRLHGMSKDAWGRVSESRTHYDVVFPGYKYNSRKQGAGKF